MPYMRNGKLFSEHFRLHYFTPCTFTEPNVPDPPFHYLIYDFSSSAYSVAPFPPALAAIGTRNDVATSKIHTYHFDFAVRPNPKRAFNLPTAHVTICFAYLMPSLSRITHYATLRSNRILISL